MNLTEKAVAGQNRASSSGQASSTNTTSSAGGELNIEANTNASDLVLDEIMKYHDVEEGDEVLANNNVGQLEMEEDEGVMEDLEEVEEEMSYLEAEHNHLHHHQSPIKSLSNLVSGPIINVPGMNGGQGSSNSSQYSDPIAAKLTSCLCKRFDAVAGSSVSSSSSHCGDPMTCPSMAPTSQSQRTTPIATRSLSASRSAMDLTTSGHEERTASSYAETAVPRGQGVTSSRDQWLHRTANNPIVKTKSSSGTMGSKAATTAGIVQSTQEQVQSTSTGGHGMLRRTMSNPLDGAMPTGNVTEGTAKSASVETASTTSAESTAGEAVAGTSATGGVPAVPVIDTRALAEASRNLTQTLKKLSKEVFTNKVDISENNSKRIGTGAVIESMKHHGKGIYSGTFSGTLNPALQDRYGRPKRDISTIIHILNDLLSATPQYRRGASISFDTGPGTQGSSTSASGGHHHHHGHHHKGSSGSGSSSAAARGQVRIEGEIVFEWIWK